MAENRKNAKHKTYRITLVEDESHNQLWVQRFTTTTLWISAVMAVLAACGIIYCLVAFTPLRTTIPGYPDARSRGEAVYNAIKIDSLEKIITRWEFYAQNLRRVVDGQEPLRIDSVLVRQSDSQPGQDAAAIARNDSLLRKVVTEAEQFELSETERTMPLEGLHFYAPLKGTVSKAYDPVQHPYIDITAPAGSVVLSVLDGTVIFSGLTELGDYTIQVQHSGDMVTIYKHNQRLLKKAGDKVSAGTPIALVGNTGSAESGDHLHFELWYKGEAVNPASYISF